jgi:hypothetical protein
MLVYFSNAEKSRDDPKVTFGHCPPNQGYITQKAYLNADFGAYKQLGFWYVVRVGKVFRVQLVD